MTMQPSLQQLVDDAMDSARSNGDMAQVLVDLDPCDIAEDLRNSNAAIAAKLLDSGHEFYELVNCVREYMCGTIAYSQRNDDKRFKVTRWCCTSGNCTNCCDLRYGRDHRRRVIQMLTDNAEIADRCFRNWREYGPIQFERTENGWAEIKRENY